MVHVGDDDILGCGGSYIFRLVVMMVIDRRKNCQNPVRENVIFPHQTQGPGASLPSQACDRSRPMDDQHLKQHGQMQGVYEVNFTSLSTVSFHSIPFYPQRKLLTLRKVEGESVLLIIPRNRLPQYTSRRCSFQMHSTYVILLINSLTIFPHPRLTRPPTHPCCRSLL